MTEQLWPTLRRRIGTIAAYFGAAALFAVVAGLLAWTPSLDHSFQATYPQTLSHGSPSVILAKVGGDDEFDYSGVEVTLIQVDQTDVARRLADGEGRVVSRATTNATGFAELELPPIGDGLELPGDDRPRQISLVVHAEVDGEDHYRHKLFDIPPEVELIMTLDRPLYQPGQTIDARVLAVRPDTGKPIETDLQWEVRDPRGNLVKRTESATSEMGISAFSFALASSGIQGAYVVTAATEDASTASNVDVRPFRLPRFTAEVVFDADRVDAGEPVVGRVVATYLYGEPVVGERVVVGLNTPNSNETLEGVTDDEGSFVVEVPTETLAGGGSVSLNATVSTEAGRMARASGTAYVVSSLATDSIELVLIPARRTSFVSNASNIGYAMVTRGGQPLAGATVVMLLPEEKTERTASVETDDDGVASFQWTPRNTNPVVSATVKLPGKSGVKFELMPPVRYQTTMLEPRTVRAEAGQELELDLVTTADLDRHTYRLVLHQSGMPVATGVVEQDGVGRVTIPTTTSGLHWVVLLSESNAGLNADSGVRVPIWVDQPGGHEVAMKLDKEEYSPGETGRLELSFPAQTARGQAEVAFGVVGVDEALYALAKRTDDMVAFALRESPSNVATIGSALEALPAAQNASQAATDIGMTRYFRRMSGVSGVSFQPYDAADISRSVGEEKRAIWRASWVVFNLALILVLMMFALSSTVRSARRGDFTWKRVGTHFGLVIASLAVAAGFAMVGGEEGFVGGAVVWCLVSFGWLLGASWRMRERRDALGWIFYTLGGVWLWGCAALGGNEVLSSHSEFAEVFIGVATIIPAGLWLLEAAIWSVILMREKEYQAGIALVSIFGVLAGGTFAASAGAPRYESLTRSSNHYMEAEMAAPSSDFAGAMAMEEEMDEMEPEMAKKSGSAAPAAAKNAPEEGPRVRSWFPETMIWVAEALADTSGVASLPIEFPDSITTWRLNAWSNSSDGRFGTGQMTVRTIQPFFVELELPTHLIEGDSIEVPVSLANRGPEPVMARVEAQVDGAFELRRPPASQIVVAPGQRAMLTLSLRAARTGEGSVTITARADDTEGGGDAVRRTARVAPDGPILRDVQAGVIADGLARPVTLPLEATPGTARLDVSIYPSITADAFDGLASMLRQPSGCFEQTSSANYPNVLVLQTLRQTKPEAWPEGPEAWRAAGDKATEFAELGYQRMLSFQHPTGGFSLYPGNGPDPMLTAYGLLQLDQMREVTLVDEETARRALRWLTSMQNHNGSWPAWAEAVSGGGWRSDSDVGQVRSTSFIVIGVASWKDELESSDTLERALDHIEARLPSVRANDTLAYAATALVMGGRAEAAKGVLSRLAKAAKRNADQAHLSSSGGTWMGGRGTYADIETTSVAAWAMIEAGTQAELLGPMLNYLAASRHYGGGWGTTQATAWTLRAFQRMRETDTGAVDLEVSFDGVGLPRATAGAGPDGIASVGGESPGLLLNFATDRLAVGSTTASITPKSGSTSAMAQIVTSYAVPWGSRLASESEGSLELSWRSATRDYRFGRPVEVVATVKNPTGDWVANAIVELPIPPGAYVDLDEARRRFTAANVELLPTHIRVYLDAIAPGSSEVFPYRFVPMVRGRVSVPPVRAYPFYAPDPISELDAGDVETR